MSEQTVKCPICGKPYVIYSMYAGDQSACQECRDNARPKFTYSTNTRINNAHD